MDALLDRASQACSRQDCETAIDLLESAVRSWPGSFALHHRLGMCYGGSCRTHSLTDHHIAIGYLRHALTLASTAPALPRATILDTLAGGYSGAREFPAAVDCETQAAALYLECGRLDDWARALFNLGNLCCDLSESSGESHWAEAIGHYQASLSVRTAERSARQHAAVLENLGTAYRHLNELPDALGCYRRALRFAQRVGSATQIAGLHNNIGNVYLLVPPRGDRRNAVRAIRHFDRAMAACGGEANPRLYSIVQHNRAQASLCVSSEGASA